MNESSSSAGDHGFVYVATGERYVAEAAVSAASLRRHHPSTRICLITDQARGAPFWDHLVVLERPRFGFRDKIEMWRAPYARCVFLDTDTTVCGDLSALFTTLTRYDVCGVQLSEGQDYEMAGGIPASFPEMNGGVIGFLAGPATQKFFALWARYYDEFHALNRDGDYHYANVGDQKSLRAALWYSDVRHAAIGAEYNFIPFRLELVSLPVAVLHTRATEQIDALAMRLNTQLGRRSYAPTFDAIVSNEPTTPELRRLFASSFRLLLRRAFRRCSPRALRDALHRSATFRRWFLGNPYESPEKGTGAKWGKPPNKS